MEQVSPVTHMSSRTHLHKHGFSTQVRIPLHMLTLNIWAPIDESIISFDIQYTYTTKNSCTNETCHKEIEHG